MSNQAAPPTGALRSAPKVGGKSARRLRGRRFWLAAAAVAALLIAALAWQHLSGPPPVRYVSAPVAQGDVTSASNGSAAMTAGATR